MLPLVYSKKKFYRKDYEQNIVRRSILECLNYSKQEYTTSVFGNYDLIHFIIPRDLNKVSDARNEFLPVIANALYCETEKRSQMTTFKERKRTLKLKYKTTLNAANLVLVPGEEAKKCLLDEGVESRIEIFPLPINFDRLQLNKESKLAVYDYFETKENEPYVLCVGDYANKVEMDNLLEIAGLCNFIKFYFCGANYSKANLSKYIRHTSENILFAGMVPEDVYLSAVINAKVLLILDPRKVEAINVMEAMAAKTQLLVYSKEKTEISFLKNNENCFIGKGSYDIANCIEKFLKGKIKSTVVKAYNYVKQFDVKLCANRLIELYKLAKKLGEEENDRYKINY